MTRVALENRLVRLDGLGTLVLLQKQVTDQDPRLEVVRIRRDGFIIRAKRIPRVAPVPRGEQSYRPGDGSELLGRKLLSPVVGVDERLKLLACAVGAPGLEVPAGEVVPRVETVVGSPRGGRTLECLCGCGRVAGDGEHLAQDVGDRHGTRMTLLVLTGCRNGLVVAPHLGQRAHQQANLKCLLAAAQLTDGRVVLPDSYRCAGRGEVLRCCRRDRGGKPPARRED